MVKKGILELITKSINNLSFIISFISIFLSLFLFSSYFFLGEINIQSAPNAGLVNSNGVFVAEIDSQVVLSMVSADGRGGILIVVINGVETVISNQYNNFEEYIIDLNAGDTLVIKVDPRKDDFVDVIDTTHPDRSDVTRIDDIYRIGFEDSDDGDFNDLILSLTIPPIPQNNSSSSSSISLSSSSISSSSSVSQASSSSSNSSFNKALDGIK